MYLCQQDHDLLSKESDSKKRLADANRIIREQGQHAVGPALPQREPGPTLVMGASFEAEPEAKRQKVQLETVKSQPVPQPTIAHAPPRIESSVPEVHDDPFAAAATAANDFVLQDVSDLLIPEADFAASLHSPEVILQIRVPNDRTQMAWNFYGQILSHTTNVMSQVKNIKHELSKAHLNGMPPNKIQLKVANGTFLKDGNTLAALNLGPTVALELVPKTRGGRK
jgi:splicing factor 3A subunit 1